MTAKNKLKTRTSIYIYNDLTQRMKKVIANGNSKTDFINDSIREKIDELENQKARADLLEFMKTIKRVKSKKTALQTINEIRQQRKNKLLGKPYKDVR